MRYSTALVFLLFLQLSPVSAQTNTQTRQNQRGQMVQGLLRDLIDSQLNFQQPQQLQPVPASEIAPQMRQVRQLLTQYASEAEQLITALRYEERYLPVLRTALSDALGVKATADVLVQRIRYYGQTSQMASEYSELDRQWRVLSHQLKQTTNISTAVLQRVGRLDQLTDQLGQQFRLDPQVESEEILHYFMTLASDLSHLSEDIRIDLFSHPKRDEYTRQVQTLKGRAEQLRWAVERGYQYEDIKRYYQQFFESWLPVKRDLRTVENRYVQRNVTRISQVNDRLHELLWLSPVIDGHDILYLADTLQRQVQSISDRIPVRRLFDVPDPNGTFSQALEFYNLCHDFRETVARETELDSLRWDFRELQVAWNDLRNVLVPVAQDDTSQNIGVVDQSMLGLRNALRLQTVIDAQQITQLASQLDNMTDLLYYDVHRYLGRSSQIPQPIRTEVVTASNDLHQAAKTLYDRVSRRADDQDLANHTRQVASHWNDFQHVVARIPAAEREPITRTVQHIAPIMAELQLLYAY